MQEDIIYNRSQANIWACLLNKDERALDFYDAHMAIVEELTILTTPEQTANIKSQGNRTLAQINKSKAR